MLKNISSKQVLLWGGLSWIVVVILLIVFGG
jgi:uncharacterized membrane protein YvbJ